jgi:3-hydroxyacyl-CoA dehydrogenase
MDLAGLDVHYSVARRLFPSLSRDVGPPVLLEGLVREGALGVKTGRGLCGEYDDRAVRRLAHRRAAVLLTLAAHDAEEEDRGAPWPD